MNDLYSFTDEQIKRIWDLDFGWSQWLQDDFNDSDLDIRLDTIYNVGFSVFSNEDDYLDEYLPEVENNLLLI